MLRFDKARHCYSLTINWMGHQVRIPVFMIGPCERWNG